MTTPQPNVKLVDGAFIEPESAADPRVAADEQFVHGLLRFLHVDSRAAQERRIARVMEEIRRDQFNARPNVFARRINRAILAAAACFILVATLAYLGIPTEQSAQAMVQASIDATRTAGPRRYAVLAELPRVADRQQQEPVEFDSELARIAVIDILDADHVLIRAQLPRGHRLVAGRNSDGEWAVRPDGSIDRFDAQRARPRWIEMNGESILFESVDALLEQLKPNYDLHRVDADPDADALPKTFDRVMARRRPASPPHLPQNISLWIHPDSRVVQRMELRWRDDVPGAARRPMHPREAGPRRPPETALHEPGPPPDELNPERPRRPMPPRLRSNSTAAADDSGSPPNQPEGELREPDALSPPPRFLDGPPRFHERGHRPPPRIIFQLIETPEFDAGWFDPETHAP